MSDFTTGVDWPNAHAALRDGKKVRRELWITWVFKSGRKLMFDLPENWTAGRMYWPTDTDKAAEDWQVFA